MYIIDALINFNLLNQIYNIAFPAKKKKFRLKLKRKFSSIVIEFQGLWF